MAGVIALALLALSMQRKYQIAGKHDWIEPLNLYVMVVAEPSERKSAVINQMIKVIHAFEANYNEAHALEREKTKSNISRLLLNEINYQKVMNRSKKALKLELKNFKTLLIKKMKNISMHLT